MLAKWESTFSQQQKKGNLVPTLVYGIAYLLNCLKCGKTYSVSPVSRPTEKKNALYCHRCLAQMSREERLILGEAISESDDAAPHPFSSFADEGSGDEPPATF